MKRGLAFSGGKDSWACLWLHEAELADIQVFHVDTGKNVPEVLETIDRARKMCPNFSTYSVNREAQNQLWGLPSDVVPVNNTVMGQVVTGKKPVLIQSYLDCCFANISLPIVHACKHFGVTELIMGQRAEDSHRGARKDGDVVEGITWRHPIESWTTAQVMEYLQSKMDTPAHFRLKHSSVDCYDCTAYRKESTDKVHFLKHHHPELYREYAERRLQLDVSIRIALETE